eukprot:CAMPEP_0201492588 /NCGR_PEP_ID=MMETSP0151_2-20130828/33838_1 /ASSEMBLY_ACC=CAM_ASM_000257 /TAXON_ID=200890 /ORGANISM="Paramoeba atlantica, Strain 621/1 / CCAP 1560/9" /LENGTH=79 /DNA_ID=CAMNT_0047879487 /DNA_START=90 /DNA_END=329 /DNA_ORIENTATION=-
MAQQKSPDLFLPEFLKAGDQPIDLENLGCCVRKENPVEADQEYLDSLLTSLRELEPLIEKEDWFYEKEGPQFLSFHKKL